MEVEGAESMKSRKEQQRERRRLRDRERRRFLSEDERERHLARRPKNYQLRRQRAEINRIDCQVQAITGGSQATLTSPPDSGTSNTVPLAESDQSVDIPMEKLGQLIGTIRLSRAKHLVRTLNKSTAMSVEASNNETTEEKSIAMSSGLRLSEVKQLVRSKGATRGIVVTTLSTHKSSYLCLDQRTQRLYSSRYVQFLEDTFPFRTKTSPPAPSHPPSEPEHPASSNPETIVVPLGQTRSITPPCSVQHQNLQQSLSPTNSLASPDNASPSIPSSDTI
ncbi:PREDICTED: LOW QUALITY PROTEIN: zinc finger CCCH domain-containing protein 18-like [Brassica oleracea var. oleracea]|uniref:LOW QUALITY PROTEIN: zinc finger CCCH domain-containing protein 18-like n=1 Tax=Brassica oleracea var. oleracea TaxID=109376 RepID=UPI0006A704F3|nr:PREDICTED: LOW QUALITY PROTEIN: zinc finger CCCH domain-containing protein 18-like [Brassica oleracea var. oleracea]